METQTSSSYVISAHKTNLLTPEQELEFEKMRYQCEVDARNRNELDAYYARTVTRDDLELLAKSMVHFMMIEIYGESWAKPNPLDTNFNKMSVMFTKVKTAMEMLSVSSVGLSYKDVAENIANVCRGFIELAAQEKAAEEAQVSKSSLIWSAVSFVASIIPIASTFTGVAPVAVAGALLVNQAGISGTYEVVSNAAKIGLVSANLSVRVLKCLVNLTAQAL